MFLKCYVTQVRSMAHAVLEFHFCKVLIKYTVQHVCTYKQVISYTQVCKRNKCVTKFSHRSTNIINLMKVTLEFLTLQNEKLITKIWNKIKKKTLAKNIAHLPCRLSGLITANTLFNNFIHTNTCRFFLYNIAVTRSDSIHNLIAYNYSMQTDSVVTCKSCRNCQNCKLVLCANWQFIKHISCWFIVP